MSVIKSGFPAKQRGSFFVTAVMLLLLGGALTVVLKVVPAYTGNSVIKNAMITLIARSDYKDMPVEEIRKELIRHVQLNGAEGFEGKSVNITHENGKDYVDINYETRVHITANIYAVVEFKNRYNKF